MLLNVNINEIDNVDVLRFICSELDSTLGDLREESFETDNVLIAYRDCLYEICDVIKSFDFDSPDSCYAVDICYSILNILKKFYCKDL